LLSSPGWRSCSCGGMVSVMALSLGSHPRNPCGVRPFLFRIRENSHEMRCLWQRL
jgi:hypothetical protein